MASPVTVDVSVSVGYELRTISLTDLEWKKVKEGGKLVKEMEDYYEGEEFIYTFFFNDDEKDGHSLIVTYEMVNDCGSGATGYLGSIEDAHIFKYSTH